MLGITAATMMQVALLATGASEYSEAYSRAEQENRPLLVLVGAPWCPGCQVMKQESIPELERVGGLKNLEFVEVDADAKPELSRQLLRGNAIPQLILFTRIGTKWRRTHMTGPHSADEISGFLKREIAKGQKLDQERQQAERTQQAATTNQTVSVTANQ